MLPVGFKGLIEPSNMKYSPLSTGLMTTRRSIMNHGRGVYQKPSSSFAAVVFVIFGIMSHDTARSSLIPRRPTFGPRTRYDHFETSRGKDTANRCRCTKQNDKEHGEQKTSTNSGIQKH